MRGLARISFTLVAGSVVVLLVVTAFIASSAVPFSTPASTQSVSSISTEVPSTRILTTAPAPSYIIAGGQEGSWFSSDQHPELYKLSPDTDFSAASLVPVSGKGTVWSGGYNGSNWLITGWGSGKYLNPYISLYNKTTTSKTRLGNYSEIGSEEQEWAGGDVFAVGWNGTDWLLTGMGSGYLPGLGLSNHMSMAVLSANGTFTDLSAQIPEQQDLILYANAWNENSSYWLVGGGWFGAPKGALFVLSGDTITNITSEIASAVPSFNSIQSIVWNGRYFLIGGVGFLAEYDGSTFTDLTAQLDQALGNPSQMLSDVTDNAVNAIAWTGTYWLIGGGTPVAYDGPWSHGAWVVSLSQRSGEAAGDTSATIFTDLTSSVIPSSVLNDGGDSTILTIFCSTSAGCAIGGSDSGFGILLWYNGARTTDLSATVNSSMSYVQWVGMPDE